MLPPHQSDVCVIKVIPPAGLVGLDSRGVMTSRQTSVMVYASIELIATILMNTKWWQVTGNVSKCEVITTKNAD